MVFGGLSSILIAFNIRGREKASPGSPKSSGMSYRPHIAAHPDSHSSENGSWPGSRMHAQNGHTSNGIGQKLEGFFDNRQLPMYKDKPYSYAASRRRAPLYKRWKVIVGAVLGILALFYLFGPSASRTPKSKGKSTGGAGLSWLRGPDAAAVDWNERRERVKEAFMLSWDGYEHYAWGKSRTRRVGVSRRDRGLE